MTTILAIEHIVSTPGVLGGEPRIAGHRLSVGFIVGLYKHGGWTIDDILQNYELTPAQVHAALAYYYDHEAEIEAIWEAERAAIPPIIAVVSEKLKAHELQPDTFSYSSADIFFVSYKPTHAQYDHLDRLLTERIDAEIVEVREIETPALERRKIVKFRVKH